MPNTNMPRLKEMYVSQINQQLERARKLEIKYPGLNLAIESGRAS